MTVKMNQFVSSLPTVILVLLMVALSTSASGTRNRHFQACSAQGFNYDDPPLDTQPVHSTLECANRCLMRDECLSFFISLGQSEDSNKLPKCHLSSTVYLCSELATSSDHTYYFASDYEQPEISNPTDESYTENLEDGIATTASSRSPTSSELFNEEDQMAWLPIFSVEASGYVLSGSVHDIATKVQQGKSIRVSIDKADVTQLIQLDAVRVSGDGALVTGTAYMYDTTIPGASEFGKVEVNTNAQVFDVREYSGVVSQSQHTSFMNWFVSNERRGCQPLTTPPNKTPSRVVSLDDGGGFTAYTASSVFDAGLGQFGLGLFVSDGIFSASMSLALKKVDLDSAREKETKVDLLTGDGGTFETPASYSASYVFTDTCFDLVLDTTAGSLLEPLLAAVQRGSKLVVSYVCYDVGAVSGQVSHVMEVERVLIASRTAQSPLVTAFFKNGASYMFGKLSWTGLTADTVGNVYDNGTILQCYGVRFYAEMSREMTNITVRRNEGLSPDDEITLDYYLGMGYLPRLKVEKTSGDLEFFTIENADFAVGDSFFLRSYRYVSSLSPAAFHVFTFDVKHCQFSYDVHNMKRTIDSPVPPGTPAQSMTLFFEKIEFT